MIEQLINQHITYSNKESPSLSKILPEEIDQKIALKIYIHCAVRKFLHHFQHVPGEKKYDSVVLINSTTFFSFYDVFEEGMERDFPEKSPDDNDVELMIERAFYEQMLNDQRNLKLRTKLLLVNCKP